MATWQLFIRHAHRDTSDRWEDNGLSEKGLRQGRDLERELQKSFPNRKVSRIISSPKIRCVETAEFVAKSAAVKVEIEPLLDEQSPSESNREFEQRVERISKQIFSKDRLCVVSHGDVLPLLAQIAGFPGVELKKGAYFWLIDGKLE